MTVWLVVFALFFIAAAIFVYRYGQAESAHVARVFEDTLAGEPPIKPSVREMLMLGEAAGVTTLAEAYDNYMSAYETVFYLPAYPTQYLALIDEMDALGLMDCKTSLRSLSLEEAKKCVEDYENRTLL